VIGEMMERIYHEAIDRKGQKLKTATVCNSASADEWKKENWY
jgi:hypothetical protein